MSVINTNITSMIGQQNLSKSQSALQTSMERLSSGLRINSAKDDAAGQAIANRMTAQITGLAQSQRNANDGISIAQTAEGGLNQINDNLQRIRELSVQAQNGTNSDSDLDSIQAEINQRLTEIDRISKETDFNGTKVLGENVGAVDSTQRTLKIQVGANDGEAIEINLEQINRDTLELAGFNVNDKGEVQNVAATKDDLDEIVADGGNVALNAGTYSMVTDNTEVDAIDVLKGVEEGVKIEVTAGATAAGLDAFLGNTTTGEVALDGLVSDGAGGFTYDITNGVTAGEADTYVDTGTAQNAVYATEDGSKSTDITIQDDGTITDRDGTALYITTAGELTYDNVGGTLNAATTTNLTAAISTADADDGTISLTLEDGSSVNNVSGGGSVTLNDVKISAEDLAAAAETNSLTITTTTTASRDGAAGQDAIVLTGDNGGNGLDVTSNGNAVYVNADDEYTQAAQESVDLIVNDNGNITDAAANQYFVGADGNLTSEAVTKGERTEDPLEVLDAALSKVDNLRSDLGAIQNRFESAIENLSTNETNLSAARSRIEDADYATEVANMTRAQILQQAGTSVLAQANQIPQSVLSLLG
ncbi:flagellin [Halomonas sp. LC1]|uniref:flagellin N-terminal helical domain-containing protein n=1 Tax=Halomonas sp. LC1 TaxID=3043733 RepID=UPI0025522AF8|nr:flagellin [Halomonas sp. LC1]MDK9687683.1 flagellin [Halomonas sp. LC1]